MTTRLQSFDAYDENRERVSDLEFEWPAWLVNGVSDEGPTVYEHADIPGRYVYELTIDEDDDTVEGYAEATLPSGNPITIDQDLVRGRDLRDVPTAEEVAAETWDTPIAEHTEEGSTGGALSSVVVGDAPTVDELAAAVAALFVSGTVTAAAAVSSARTNLSVVAGNTIALSIQALDLEGDPVNLTGVSRSEFVVKKRMADAAALIEKTFTEGGGVTVPTPSNGISVVALVAADTIDLDHGRYEYEHVVVIPAGRFRVARGEFHVDGAVVGA